MKSYFYKNVIVKYSSLPPCELHSRFCVFCVFAVWACLWGKREGARKTFEPGKKITLMLRSWRYFTWVSVLIPKWFLHFLAVWYKSCLLLYKISKTSQSALFVFVITQAALQENIVHRKISDKKPKNQTKFLCQISVLDTLSYDRKYGKSSVSGAKTEIHLFQIQKVKPCRTNQEKFVHRNTVSWIYHMILCFC